MRKLLLLFVVSLFVVSSVFLTAPAATGSEPQINSEPSIDPQYVIINRIYNITWHPKHPNRIDDTTFNEMKNQIGTEGTSNRRLGIGMIIPYLENDVYGQETVEKLTQLSQTHKIPVLFKLHGIAWWETRTDLWNWFDPDLPDYDPNNKDNVEWTSWDRNDAIKLCWRNWGNQFRVRPHPNLGSPEYIQAKQDALRPMLSHIADWYRNLPEDEKYLLAGVVLDGELAIGVNFYYYPDGNQYYGEDPNDDPFHPHDWSQGMSAGFQQLGYAAVRSYGIKNSGEITMDDLNEAVHRHAEMLTSTALDQGVPFDKIFVHGFGNVATGTPPNITETDIFDYGNVITNFGRPGWSFYKMAFDPGASPMLNQVLDTDMDNTPWGALEWNYQGGLSGSTREQWSEALENTLTFKNCRLVQVYSWTGGANDTGIEDNPEKLEAIADVLDATNVQWLRSASIRSYNWKGSRAVICTWKAPSVAENATLRISRSGARRPSGALAAPIRSWDVSGMSSKALLYLKPGRYYWEIEVEGFGGSQKRITTGTFTVKAMSLPQIKPLQRVRVSGLQLQQK